MAPTARYGCNAWEISTTENQTNLANSQSTDNLNGHDNLRLASARGDGAPNAGSASDECARENGGSAARGGARSRGVGAGVSDDARSCRGSTRTRLNLASLNVNGYATTGGGQDGNKWLMINQLVRDEKICILALQETHLTARRKEELEGLFGQYLSILCGNEDQFGARAGGVAFVVNKRRMSTEAWETVSLVPGRALMLKIPWTNGRMLTILNVYAPNAAGENADFWKKLKEVTPQKPDVMMGDFNVVEDGIDRLPMRRDPERPTSELRALCREMHLVDGWRSTNRTLREYTYMQGATGSQSRLDRIYGTARILKDASVWTIKEAGVPTDHKMVTVSLANRAEPFRGGGRWSMPTHLLEDAEMIETMKRIGAEFAEEVEAITERSETRNPQLAYAAFKEKLRLAARERAKTKIPKVRKQLERMRLDLRSTLNPEGSNEVAGDAMAHAAILQDRITKLEIKYFSGKRKTVEEAHWVRDEKISKQWIRKHAVPLPPTTIAELAERRGERTTYTSHAKRMAEIAKKHYDDLQRDEQLRNDEPHDEYIAQALEGMQAKITNRQKAKMASKLTRAEVVEAVRAAAGGKAPGLDGLPSEVWKAYARWYEADQKRTGAGVDVMKALTKVFNDIAANGTSEGLNFAEGMICPIYKLKKDKREIVNYRPITLLNSDYKMMTRVLASRLAALAHTIIHPDQAGFIPGRSIFDQINLNKMVIEYAEAEEANGVIVALDQEKAYDKIDHTYIMAALRRMNFPESFIRTIRILYERAASCVMLNGVKSSSFQITRGVRQGDPMSCLLFVIAIEPLACALRRSPIAGLDVPGGTERLVTALFADDTTIFLGESDDYEMIEEVTGRWCRASRARFNMEKTEIIPVGSPEYRKSVWETRRMRVGARPLPPNVRVARDGEAIRSLGAWIGNKADDATPWSPILAAIERALEKWEMGRPSLKGRRLIVNMEVGGRTQFLAKAQGMPSDVESKLKKIINTFVWAGDKHPRVSSDVVIADVKDGGLGILDIGARNDAIRLMLVKDYLNLSPARPRWATLADALIARAVTAASPKTHPKMRINLFLQRWDVDARSRSPLPTMIREMIGAARKYGVRCCAKLPSKELKNLMPVWMHIGAVSSRARARRDVMDCLRLKHRVSTVGECAAVAERIEAWGEGHEDHAECECLECAADRSVRGCNAPNACAKAAERLIANIGPKWNPRMDGNADGLTLTRRRIEENDRAWDANERIIFNPTVSQEGPAANALRVFTTSNDGEAWATRTPRPFVIAEEAVEVYLDGSCVHGRDGSVRAGCGIWYGDGDLRNKATRVNNERQTNQIAELEAVLIAVKDTPTYAPMHIVSDSHYVIEGLTKHARKWEDLGWINVVNASMLKKVVAALRARCAPTTFRWVKGHSGIRGNEEADALAKEGASYPRPLGPAERLCTKYLKEGASLPALTQSLAYKGIRARKTCPTRPATARNITIAQTYLEGRGGGEVDAARIWTTLREDVIRKQTRDFLWKALHGALRIGSYWGHIEGYEGRKLCGICGTTEDLNHIIVECVAPERKRVWILTEEALKKKGVSMGEVSLGLALGAHATIVRKANGTPNHAATRILRIAVSEAVHLIWVLRCERVIARDNREEEAYTDRETSRRWQVVLTRRLRMDQAAARRAGPRKRAAKLGMIERTWGGLIDGAAELPPNWALCAGVLVGIPTDLG